jgi:hypothetical protein
MITIFGDFHQFSSKTICVFLKTMTQNNYTVQLLNKITAIAAKKMQSLAPNVFGKGILKIITFVTAQCGGSSPFYPYISMVLSIV